MTAAPRQLDLEPNPDLAVGADQKPAWNRPSNRRHGFRNLHRLSRYGLHIRAPQVLRLHDDPDPAIGRLDKVAALTRPGSPFAAIAVVQGQRLLYEAYSPDMAPDQPHSIQSISKTPVNLIVGRLVADGRIDLGDRVDHYLPEIGSGYGAATVQQVLDMDVVNNFNEDYADHYGRPALPGESLGYNREEIAMGWRLPPPGEKEFSCRDFLCTIESEDITNPSDETQYRSPNTDVLAWIAERVSGEGLRDLLVQVVAAAGIAGTYYISTDHSGVPVIAGGASLTARDLARYGLIFARLGRGVQGEPIGDEAFLRRTLADRGTQVGDCRGWVRYSNHCYTNGRWLGHLGFAGQVMMADPQTGSAIAFFSVIESQDGDQEGYFPAVMAMGQQIFDHLT